MVEWWSGGVVVEGFKIEPQMDADGRRDKR